MNAFSLILVYGMVWWIVFLMVLPWAVRSPHTPETGHDPGAPEHPFLGRKIITTTGISALILIMITLLLPWFEQALGVMITHYEDMYR